MPTALDGAKAAALAMATTSTANAKQYTRWRGESAATRARLGISSGWCGWTGLEGISCHGIARSNERALDVLDCAWAWRLKRLGGTADVVEARKGFFADTSQSVARMPWSTCVKTLCQSSCIYSFELDRVLDGQDTMMLQGWSRNGLSSFGSDLLRHLSGEGYTLPCAAVVLYSYWLNASAPWWIVDSTPPTKRRRTT